MSVVWKGRTDSYRIKTFQNDLSTLSLTFDQQFLLKSMFKKRNGHSKTVKCSCRKKSNFKSRINLLQGKTHSR